ncbi:hypothetical protein T4E_9390 [Trichinella pseudospiralis]|uniref:Uncharacterized protein n=1 Tax=Trichinella pseudospiralis TaxID=6337 RepID=A0A0V0Y4M9_TRIPS|nr:hypothetical protein T4E_9390 [Trichinella pseudospiralis]
MAVLAYLHTVLFADRFALDKIHPFDKLHLSVVVYLALSIATDYCETASGSLTIATPNLRTRHDSTAHLDGRVAEDRLSFPGSSRAHHNDSLTTAEDGGGAVAFDTVDEHNIAASNSSTSIAAVAAGQQASRLVRLDNDNNKQQIDQPSHVGPVEEQAEEHRVHLDAATLAAADSAPFARLGDDIDVSLLTRYLYPESETVETAEPWSLDFLCGVVSAQFLPNYTATTLTHSNVCCSSSFSSEELSSKSESDIITRFRFFNFFGEIIAEEENFLRFPDEECAPPFGPMLTAKAEVGALAGRIISA